MAMTITKEDIWVAEIEDQPGALAQVLEALAAAGADLHAVIGRREANKPGTGLVYLTPLKGRKQADAARSAGLSPATDIINLRIEGPDKPGIGGRIARAIADAGVNIRGVSAVSYGNKFVAYIGMDSAADAAQATRAIKALDKQPARKPARALAKR